MSMSKEKFLEGLKDIATDASLEEYRAISVEIKEVITELGGHDPVIAEHMRIMWEAIDNGVEAIRAHARKRLELEK